MERKGIKYKQAEVLAGVQAGLGIQETTNHTLKGSVHNMYTRVQCACVCAMCNVRVYVHGVCICAWCVCVQCVCMVRVYVHECVCVCAVCVHGACVCA